MFQKNCYQCHKPSFSSCESGKWLCPACGYDLTNQNAYRAGKVEKPRKKKVLYVHLKKATR